MAGFCAAEGRRWRPIEAALNNTESLDQASFQPHHHECSAILHSETRLLVMTPNPLHFYSGLHVQLGVFPQLYPSATPEFRWFIRPQWRRVVFLLMTVIDVKVLLWVHNELPFVDVCPWEKWIVDKSTPSANKSKKWAKHVSELELGWEFIKA